MRVLVTRPLPEAERTAARLASLGFEPVVAPVLTIRQSGTPPPPGAFAALLVTSAQAVPALAAVRGAITGEPVFAVGERTAAALRQAGVARVACAAGDAEDMAAMVVGMLPARARLLHVAGRDHKPEPARSLSAAGFDVVAWIAYTAETETELPATAAAFLRESETGLALHYSRRSLDTLLRLADKVGLAPALMAVGHACLSADVATPLAARGGKRIVVAARPDEDALLAALKELGREADPAGSSAPQSRC